MKLNPREDLGYGKRERFRLKLEDLCYAWAILEEEAKRNLGREIRVNKVGNISKEERYVALYTRWLVSHLLSGIVSPKRYRYYTALILVRNLKLMSCKKLLLILDKNEASLQKARVHDVIKTANKILNKELLKQIELEALKLAERVVKEKEKKK
jgi:hypothetical protein